MATVTFSKTGVVSPVYIVSSMSDPPWKLLEMNAGGKSEYGCTIFSYTFSDVSEGAHQYKICIGDGLWVIDETKEISKMSHCTGNHTLC